MKELKSVSDEVLLTEIKAFAVQERQAGLEVIRRLREIDRRKLFLDLGYGSLFTYCVKELGYSESAAFRRIQAMELLEEVPEAEEAIAEGRLSLTAATQVQVFCERQEREAHRVFEPSEKLELLRAVESKSKREAERVLAELAPVPIEQHPSDRVRALDATHSEVRFVTDNTLLKKLERIRELRSHARDNATWADLLNDMADLVLAKIDPERKVKESLSPEKAAPQQIETRHIPEKVRREVWKRDGGRCTYEDPRSGRRCETRRYLDADHIEPWALGGSHEPENLRLLCRAHNLRRAQKTFAK